MSKYVGFLMAAGVACLPMAASAAAPTLTEVLDASGVTLGGHISGSYVYGFNDGQLLGGRSFDTVTDSFVLNQAALRIGKLPAEGAGGYLDVMAGDDAQVINSAYGDNLVAIDTDGDGVVDAFGASTDKFNITQAYLQYATGPFTVMGGRFVTLAGAEVINDSANANISRSILFGVIPFVHTGVRTSAKLGAATVYLGASNSAFAFAGTDVDPQKTLELGVSVAPNANSSLMAVVYHGVDKSIAQENTLLDVVASLQATNALQLVLNADYKVTDFDAPGAEEQTIWGVAGYANLKFNDRCRGSLRAEHVDFSDIGGVAGSDNDVQSLTATFGHMVATNLELLGEVRWDNSDLEIFPDGASSEDSQGDVAVKAIYKF